MSRPDKRTFQTNVLGTAKEEAGSRLFAFTNNRQGYQVVFSPEAPLIVLKTKRSAVADQHPCLQWEPLGKVVFERHPTTTHALFVLDASPSADAPAMLTPEQEELSVGASIGGSLKRVVNALTRLNPHNGTLVAAGVSAVVAFKYVLVGEKTLGHRDRLLQHLLLVCPGGVDVFQRLGTAIQRRNEAQGDRNSYPLPDITVLVKAEDAATQGAQWLNWLKSVSCDATMSSSSSSSAAVAAAEAPLTRTPSTLFNHARVLTDLSPSLFAAIAGAAGIESDGAVVDVNKQLETPEVYRIAFALSRATKTIEQYPLLAPLHTPGYEELEESADGHGHSHGHHHHEHGEACDHDHTDDDDDAHEDHDHDDAADEEEGENDGDAAGELLVPGLSSLAQCRDPVRIVLEGRVLSLQPGLIGTTEGVVRVSGMDALLAADDALNRHVQSKLKVGAPVFASASLRRDSRGCTSLHALEMQPMTKVDVKHSVTVGDSLADIPSLYNVSDIPHSYGAVLIRGRKCALVRTVQAAPKRGKKNAANAATTATEPMRFPTAPHSLTKHSAIECATEALCQGCEVSADNFYFPNYVSPITFYVPVSPSDASSSSSSSSAVKVRCVTLYVALAVNPPPRGAASDAVEDAPEPQEPYDWVSFTRALRLLGSDAERDALRAIQTHLAQAAAVGLYQPFTGCGVFGDAVKPLAGDDGQVVAAAAAAAGAVPFNGPVSLKGTTAMVLFCPGVASTAEVTTLTRSVFPHSPCLSFSLYTTTAMLNDALEQHARQSHMSAPFLLHVADDVDVANFCEERLVPLSEDLGIDVSVFTVLTTAAATRLFAHDDDRSDAQTSAAALRDRLFSCAVASDAVVTVESDANALPPSAWAALALCAEANPDAMLIAGLESRRPLDNVPQRVFPTAPSSCTGANLVLHRVNRTTTTPLAPAALHYLTQAESLSRLYVTSGALHAVLVLVSAEAWLGTRPAQQAHIALDAENRCLEITPGTPWESSQEDVDVDKTPRASHWCVVAQLCASQAATEAETAALCARLESLVDEMVRQVEYQAARDGPDYHVVHDPLPTWEEGWDDEDDDCEDCEDQPCGAGGCKGSQCCGGGHHHH